MTCIVCILKSLAKTILLQDMCKLHIYSEFSLCTYNMLYANHKEADGWFYEKCKGSTCKFTMMSSRGRACKSIAEIHYTLLKAPSRHVKSTFYSVIAAVSTVVTCSSQTFHFYTSTL